MNGWHNFKAKEKTELPEDIFTDINAELKKNFSINIEELNYRQVREILKN